jgi:Tol biopolymer transport system component
VPRRVTFDSAIDGSATFSPDGQRLAYGTDKRSDIWDIVVRAADGTGSETVLLESEENKNVSDWSPDGRYILYASQSEATGFDLWALPLFGTQQPIELARTPFREVNGQFSPDGKWVALDSNETGQSEVYVQSFPQSGLRLRVSSGGGTRPRWRLTGSGLELFYVAPGLELMAVTLMERGGTLDASPARPLFTLPSASFEPTGSYEVAPDGQRFLVPASVSMTAPITVILGWRSPQP